MREGFEESHRVLLSPRGILQAVQRDPAVRGEVLEHRNHELQAAVPMGQENDQGDQIQDAHHHTGDGQELEGGEEEEDEDREMKTMRRSSTK